MRNILLVALGILALQFADPTWAAAQDAPPRHLSASVGVFSYQLAENGVAPMLAIRGSTPVSSVLVLEAGVIATRPDQIGRTEMFVAPEAMIQLALPFESLVPYMGLGFGGVFDFNGDDGVGSTAAMTLSGAVGVRYWLNPQLGLQGEFRGRGIGFDFDRSSSEYSLGLAYRL